MSSYVKDPQAKLDFTFDWNAPPPKGPWLNDGETIASYTVTVPAGLTKVSDSQNAGKVTVWLSGGVDKQTYEVTSHIVTNQGREDDRTIRIHIRPR